MAAGLFSTWDKLLCMMLCRELVKLDTPDDISLRILHKQAKTLTTRNKYLREENKGPYPESIKSFWLQALAKTCRFWNARVRIFRSEIGVSFLFQSGSRMRLVLAHERKLRTKKRIATLHRDSLIAMRSVVYSLIPDCLSANAETSTNVNILVTKPIRDKIQEYSFLEAWNMIKGNKTKIVCKAIRLAFAEVHGWDWDVRLQVSFTPAGVNVPFRDKMVSILYNCVHV